MKNYKINVGYLYNDSFSEKEFLDAVLKKINDDNSAPSYIFDEMEKSEVFRIEFPIFLCDGNAEIEYSRMIGFDKIETTTKYKTDAYGNKTHSTTSRTITDWKMDSGVISGSASSGTILDEYKIYDEYITNHVMDKNNVRELTNEELDNYHLTDDNIEYLKNDILKKAFEANITYPANHVKNEEYYGTVSLFNTTVTIVSMYAMELQIRDKSLLFIAISNGDIEIKVFGEYPIDNYDEINNFNMAISKQRLEATKKPRALSKYTILLTLLLFILLLVLGISLDILALTIISIVILVLGLIITLKFRNDVKKISKPYYKQIYDNNIRVYNENEKAKQEGYQRYILKNSQN
jgi:hypothetical protein